MFNGCGMQVFLETLRDLHQSPNIVKNRMNLNNITCCEFNGSWSDIALKRSSLRAGYENVVLGENAVLGRSRGVFRPVF